MITALKYWVIRLLFRKAAHKLKLPFHPYPELGDIVVSGKSDLEYIGKGLYLAVSKEDSINLLQGERIKRYLKTSGRTKNQFVLRNGKPIAERVNLPNKRIKKHY